MTDSTGSPKPKGFKKGASQRAKETARKAKLAQALRDEANQVDLVELCDPQRALVRQAIRELVVPTLDAANQTGTDSLVLPHLPKLQGAKPKIDLWIEVLKLSEAGLSQAKIAQKINQKHGEGTATPESVRKIISRHSPDKSRKLISDADKKHV